MKNLTRLKILSALSIIITSFLYYMTYDFNVKYHSVKRVLYVSDYLEAGGLNLIIGLLLLLSVFTIIFIRYVLIDSNELEFFLQSGKPEYYNKRNLLAFNRLFQYYVIASSFILLIRDGRRAYNYSASIMAMYIFKTDVLFIMWDVVFFLFFILTITLFIELLNQLKTINWIIVFFY